MSSITFSETNKIKYVERGDFIIRQENSVGKLTIGVVFFLDGKLRVAFTDGTVDFLNESTDRNFFGRLNVLDYTVRAG